MTHLQPSTYKEQLHAEYKARQARFAAAARPVAKKQKDAIRAPMPLLPPPDRIKPLWMFGHIRFDHHVDAYAKWREEQALIGGHRLKRYIRDRAQQLGSTYEAIIGHSRKQKIVTVRQQIIWEIKTEIKPHVSLMELGRLFGGKDHTTILHAIRRVSAIKAGEE